MIEKNEWSPLSELLSDLIAKYADALDIDSLPTPVASTTINSSINIPRENHEDVIANDIVA